MLHLYTGEETERPRHRRREKQVVGGGMIDVNLADNTLVVEVFEENICDSKG